MLYANGLFLMAHNDNGSLTLQSRIIGLGLAAGLLTELLHEGKIAVDGSKLLIAETYRPPHDALTHKVLVQLHAERNAGHTTRTWLTFLAGTAYTEVGQRLTMANMVRPVKQSFLRGGGVRYERLTADHPYAILATQVRGMRPLHQDWQALLGLAWAVGLERELLAGAPPNAAEHIKNQIAHLPKTVQDLLAECSTAIGQTVMTHR